VAVNRYDTERYMGGTAYLGKDVMGSVAGVTDGYGVTGERYEYDVFGEPYAGDLGGGMNLGYTGKPYDVATGLYDYGYRDYMPAAARFTTEDPVRDGANWFAYVNNDPVNWIDPWGLSASDKDNKGGFFSSLADATASLGQSIGNKASGFATSIVSATQNLHGDIFITAELDLIAGLGIEASISFVFDLDHPLESGINISGGYAAGVNVGIGAGIGYTRGDIEGQMPLGVDGNFGYLPASIALLTDDKGLAGGSVSLGPGIGFSISSQNSATLSPQAIINFIHKHFGE
jgi:RHS repeat-associated protein